MGTTSGKWEGPPRNTEGFTPVRNGKGWRLVVGPLTLDIESPRLDRGSVRTTLTVRTGDTILYRDTVNLTATGSRNRVVSALKEKGIALDEGALIALDEAYRNTDQVEDTAGGGGSPFPEDAPVQPFSLTQLKAAFSEHLLIEDDDYLTVVVGAILAHRLTGEPVWLLIVGPPGGTKTESLRPLYGYPGIYPLSKLTARTLASGLDKGDNRQASLLSRLSREILVLKDFTTVLELSANERREVLAQLREVYDGRLDAVWGTGSELHWKGRLGFIAGVTEAIDKHQVAMALMGERFVVFRPRMPDRRRLAIWTAAHAGQEEAMRRSLTGAMHRFLRARGTTPPGVSDDIVTGIAVVADLVTRARSPVERDWNRQLQYAPEPEAPTRFAKVLLSLARGIALAHDASEVMACELRLVTRVAIDSIPPVRRVALSVMSQHATPMTVGEVATQAGLRFSQSAIDRAIQDLTALGVVTKVMPVKANDVQRSMLSEEWAEALRAGSGTYRSTANEARAASPSDATAQCDDTVPGKNARLVGDDAFGSLDDDGPPRDHRVIPLPTSEAGDARTKGDTQ